ncbi:MAG TPA: fibronectin type III domain-containing protein, partial [Roseiflexaceae bacterium]|nr:fibronectin type III domain-containing protein [Roseiflexaceae bacterium]
GLRVENGDQSSTPINYDVRLIEERMTVSTVSQIGQPVPATFTMSSDTPLALVNLNLPPQHNNRVRVTYSWLGNYNGQPYLQHLNGSILYSNARTMAPASDAGGIRTNTIFQSAANGNYALAISYNGPRVFTNEPPPPPEAVPEHAAESDQANDPIAAEQLAEAAPSPADTVAGEAQPTPPNLPELSFRVNIEVISCGPGEIPTSNGSCQRLECPTSSTPAGVFQQAGGLGIWSFGGWEYADAQQNAAASRLTNAQNQLNSAVLIGGPNQQTPTVAVVNGVVRYNKSQNQILIDRPANGSVNDILLINCAANPIRFFHVHSEEMQRTTRTIGNTTIAVLQNKGSASPAYIGNANPWYDSDFSAGDLSQYDFYINPAQGLLTAATSVRRRLDTVAPYDHDLNFRVTWSLGINGWLAVQTSTSAAAGNPQPPDVASLSLALGNQLSVDIKAAPNGLPEEIVQITPRKFEAIRARQAIITQSAGLGGASGAVQAVMLPRGVARPSDTPAACPGGSCIDLRGPNDSANLVDRVWAMPDIKTSGQVGMQAFIRDGETLVFSNDHPATMNNSFQQNFSFEGHKGVVSVQEERCIDNPQSPGYSPSAPIVTVVRGEVRVAVPNIGSSGDPSALIAASFKLCEGTMRSVHLEFKSPIGVPIATSGLFLTGLDGSVDIMPNYTQIRVGVTFQAAQGGDGGVFTARGQVLIDTRGMFEFQGNARIMGMVNANGRIWVAWNPIDIGLDATISIGDWLSGRVYAHMWQGQGWGNKYTWLPKNNAMHFAGMIQATITIKEGAVIDIWELQIPPSDISIGVELAFGEFCTNSTCTQYEWGIKGKLVILGFDIGLYYGFEEGLDFILGNDNHILIDQYNGKYLNGAALKSAQLDGVKVLPAPKQSAGVALQPIVIESDVEQILAGFSWMAGNPRLSLVRPDGVEITPANGGQYGAKFHQKPGAMLVGLADPQPGTWQAKFSNLSADGIENYTFLYLANRGAPGRAGQSALAEADRLTVQPAAGATHTINWVVPADAQPHHTISLFYRRTEAISGTLHQDVPITRNRAYTSGSFQWDTTGMLNGDYQVYAVIDDGRNMLPEQEISLPNNSCIALYGPYPRARAFDSGRFPGTDIFTATTTVQVNDTIAPPPPQGIELQSDGDGLRVRWQAQLNPAGGLHPDISTYRLRWGPRSGPNTFQEMNRQEVAATATPMLRIGGLNNGQMYGVVISAVDANGNASTESTVVFATVNEAGAPIPLAPINLNRTAGTSNSVALSWARNPEGVAPSSYRLSYTRLDGTSSSIGYQNAATTSTTITNLAPGGTYDIQVAALNATGWTSSVSGTLRVVISNRVDGNGDGLPDDWANARGVGGAAGDADGDGLSNGQEYTLGTDPLRQDSDNDGQSDGEEHAAGTDPLKDSDFTAAFSQPRLSLSENTLTFRIQPAATMEGKAMNTPQSVQWRNIGGGTLQIQAHSASPWIKASVVGNQLQVAIEPDQLAPGFHSGVIALQPQGGTLIGAPQCVRVKTWVYPGAGTASGNRIFIPIATR